MANSEHVKLLEQGVEKWNAWRITCGKVIRPRWKKIFYKDKPHPKCDGKYIDLQCANLREMNLSGADLSVVDLSGADLSGADLSGADLSGADLSGAKLGGADLSGADLSGMDLNKAIFRYADFRNANLSCVDLSNANLENMVFEGAVLSGANLRNANLKNACISGANLSGAILCGADLRDARLRYVRLTNANLSNAILSGALLSGADLTNADLSNANLIHVKLAYGQRHSANLSGATLRGTKFTSFQESNVDGSILDLMAAEGIETAIFDSPEMLHKYVAEAFEYIHRPYVEEAWAYPNFFEKALERIKMLHELYVDQEPSLELIHAVQTITAEIINYLKKHPKAMHELRPRQFEELIAEILASFGWHVQLSQATRDGGYDIFAITKEPKADVETSWIIECKKYAPQRKVGIDIVRQLYGVKIKLEVANMMLATTSYFTEGVKKYKASQYDLELKDYQGILEWINEYRPNPEGRLYIRDNKLIVPREDEKNHAKD